MKRISRFAPWPPALFLSLVVFIPSFLLKFSGAAESRHIFIVVGEYLGLPFFEPYGRIFIGTAELITSILFLIPRTQLYGALLAVCILGGAIFFHLFSPLEIVIHWVENGTTQQDATLFILAVLSFFAGSVIIRLRWKELEWLFNKMVPIADSVHHESP